MAADRIFNIFLWTLLAVIIAIMWPLCAYAVYILRKNWNSAYLVKRRRKATYFMLFLCCLSLFVSLPLTTVMAILYESAVPPSILLAVWVPTHFTLFGCAMLVNVRIWLYYFDILYSKEMSSKEWKALITECISTNEWFTAHRHTYGCHHYCSKRVALISIIVVAIHAVLFDFIGRHYAHIFDTAAYAMIIFLSFCVWFKYPKFNDALGIRAELKKILILWTSVLLLYAAPIFLSQEWLILLAIAVISTNLSCVVYFTIILEHKKRKVDSADDKYQDVNVRAWQPFIPRLEGYTLFMDHLVKEFSTENLLFITEYAQFKSSLIEIYPNEMAKLKGELPWNLSLPTSDKLPLSYIVSQFKNDVADMQMNNDGQTKLNDNNGNNPWTPFLTASLMIYEKYIHADCARFEVNIDSKRRTVLAQLFENQQKIISNQQETLKVVLLSLEPAVNGIEALMNDSFLRFKRTKLAKEYWTRYMLQEK